MYKILVAAPWGLYPNCPVDTVKEAQDFFTASDTKCWSSVDPNDIERCDGIVVPGGLPDVDPAYWGEPDTGCHVTDKKMDQDQMRMIRRAVELRKPILGICRGMQLVSAYFGATLIQDIGCGDNHRYEPGNPRFHDIYNVPGTPLHDIYGDVIYGNSGHHQALKKIPDCLSVSQLWCANAETAPKYIQLAQADELHEGSDECIIEAVYHKEYPFVGLQWHPELGGELYCSEVDVGRIKGILLNMIDNAAS